MSKSKDDNRRKIVGQLGLPETAPRAEIEARIAYYIYNQHAVPHTIIERLTWYDDTK